jgi:extradiol dioxygenase
MIDKDTPSFAYLAYIGFESPAHGAWTAFGPEVLGLELVESTEDIVLLRNDDVRHNIAIHRGQSDRLAYLGWAVANERAWDLLVERLTRAGVATVEGRHEEAEARGVLRMATFTDPAGYTHEIIFGQCRESGTFRPARPISGFVARDQGLGHVALLAPAEIYEDLFDFYTNTLGFRQSDRALTSGVLMDFFHVNPRHHSLAIARSDGVRGIHHLLLQVHSPDDVGTTLDLCQARQIPITRSLGVHTTDRMFSFYLRTPSGFDIEYGAGAREIDMSSPWTVGYYEMANVWGHEYDPDIPPGTCIRPVQDSLTGT